MKQDLPRVEHLRRLHDEWLTTLAFAQNAPRRAVRRPGAAFAWALAMDPTPKAIYLSTIVSWLRRGIVRFEDARRVRTILAAFDARKRSLKQRDIGRYASPGELSEALGMLAPAQVEDVPPEVLAGGPIVASGDGWAIFSIVDPAAAVWWADSTDWCTRQPHHAKSYLSAGPLHVVRHGRTKLQFHVVHGQFMDRHDRQVGGDILCELPEDCLDAIMEILKAHPGFRNAAIDRVVVEELARRRGVEDRENAFLWRENTFVSNTTAVHLGTKDGAACLVSRRRGSDGWPKQTRTTESDLLDHLDQDGIVHEFVKAGADRMKRQDISVMIPPETNEMSILFQLLGRRKTFSRLCRHDGTDVLLWQTSTVQYEDPRFECLWIDGPQGERTFRLSSREDFAGLPPQVASALERIVGSSDFLDFMGIVDVNLLPGEVVDEWRTPEGRSHLLEMLMAWKAPKSRILEAAKLAFEGDQATAVARLSSRIDVLQEKRAIQRKALAMLDASDFDAVIDVGMAGTLLAGMPDEQCSEELVDRFIAAGSLEVLAVMPSRFFTVERLFRAKRVNFVKPLNAIVPIAGRIVSGAAFDALDTVIDGPGHYFPLLEDMKRFMEDFLVRKGASELTLKAGFSGYNARPDDQVRFLLEQHRGFDLEEIFDGIPPVGRPWRLAFRMLQKSLDGIDDVATSLRNGNWGRDRDDLWLELRSIPGANEALADIDQRRCRGAAA